MSDDTLHYDPRLIEEAVFLCLREHPKAGEFDRERCRPYEISDPEERERGFQDLHRAWFIRLGLAHPIEEALGEQPILLSRIKTCLVGRTAAKKLEGAELFVGAEEGSSDREQRNVRILLRPESLLDPAALLSFLRHELLHITDMLDPDFGYEPVLPAAAGGPAHDRLLAERYRALWDATIDGRMSRRGWASESVRAERLKDFRRAFPMLGEDSAPKFSQFFDHERSAHPELVAFACNPLAGAGDLPTTASPGNRCPLCGFPTHSFAPEPDRLPPEVIAAIVTDFPNWRPAHGLCLQCADLYRARETSISAALCLPGSRMI
ncbi:MAG: hypothetical protein HYV04_21800 [Deltaproteobacteria bacterium]|nr:hypothetical protein [Deltaproteobacteria bacterium]